jgi:response regulator RpfG family c-di-GMP phosphodiesterase
MKTLNVLVADDETDITEIIGLLIGALYTAEFSYAYSGKSAVALIAEAKEKFDLVVCDFNMPNGNGKLVSDYIQQNQLDIPFILITSDLWDEHPVFKNRPKTYYLQKPFEEDTLNSAVAKALEALTLGENSYIGISLNTLLKIQKITTPLYLKLNESKYVKVINEGNIFDETEYQKYKQKNVLRLYVVKDYFNELVEDFRKKILTELFFKTYKSAEVEEFQISASVNEIISSTVASFGFNEQTVTLARENIKFVNAIVDKISNLQGLLRWLEGNDYKYELTHSLLICFLATAIAQKFKFQNPHACENIALAAFFHDVSLEAYQIENEPRFREALRQGIHINKSDVDLIRQHPKKSAELLAEWHMCPPEVLTIIENHCERPDGQGFPRGLVAKEFDEMSACFVFCEDLVNFFLASRSKSRINEFIAKNGQLYSAVPFKNFLDLVKELLHS